MSKILMVINLLRWKSKMKKLRNTNVFTQEGWEKCHKALLILPEDQREAFLKQFVSSMIGM